MSRTRTDLVKLCTLVCTLACLPFGSVRAEQVIEEIVVTAQKREQALQTFGPGEVVFASKGSKMTWQITERLRKYYMTSA